MDLLPAPDQMVLQVHESIDPLELDRILGDERTTTPAPAFTPDMFGTYRYGSEPLNVTFDPVRAPARSRAARTTTRARAGAHAPRQGRNPPGGGALSQAQRARCRRRERARDELEPSADRPHEPGTRAGPSSLDEMIRAVERGVYMEITARGRSTTAQTSSSLAASADA